MTTFKVNETNYELTMYFDARNKEFVRYVLMTRKGDNCTMLS